MARYAAQTTVGRSASIEEIERILTRYGASEFMQGWNQTQAVIGFVVHARQVKFIIPLPDREDPEFTLTPTTQRPRSADAAYAAFEQAVRQRWRALALVVKAKLEAVDAGIVTFEQEFMPFIVLPGTGGRTVAEFVAPAVEEAYRSGTVPPLLGLPGPKEIEP